MNKDAVLSHAVIKYLLRFWPVSSADKVLVFICTLKDAISFLTMTDTMELLMVKEMMERLRACMGRCVDQLAIAQQMFS